MIESISGIVTAILIIIISKQLSKYFTIKLFAATILVSIAFIYVGFSLKENTNSSIILEVAIALFFYFLALIGYTHNTLLLAFGIMLHGVWDAFHYDDLFVKTDIPGYWPSFCFIVDIIDGLFFLFVFMRIEKAKQLRKQEAIKSKSSIRI